MNLHQHLLSHISKGRITNTIRVILSIDTGVGVLIADFFQSYVYCTAFGS